MGKWSGVTQDLKESAKDQRVRVRWRKKDENIQPMLEGEAYAIVQSNGFKRDDWRAQKAVLALMKLIGNSPDLFLYGNPVEESKGVPTAGLGRILHARVAHLSGGGELQAQNFVRTWMSSDTDVFTQVHLPKLLRYAQSRKNGTQIQVEDLLELIHLWEYRRQDVLSAISREFFYNKKEAKPNE